MRYTDAQRNKKWVFSLSLIVIIISIGLIINFMDEATQIKKQHEQDYQTIQKLSLFSLTVTPLLEFANLWINEQRITIKNEIKSLIMTFDPNNEKMLNYFSDILLLVTISQGSIPHLIYRASEYNFDSYTLHQLKKNKIGNFCVLVRSKSQNIFGGCLGKEVRHPKISFLFSLDKQTKHFIFQNEDHNTFSNSSVGPTLGNGFNLHLSNNCNKNSESYTDLGNTYELPNGIIYQENEARSYLAGSYHFEVEEYEVFEF